MTVNLSGSVALVTGVQGRLGPVWAQALLAHGALVAGLDVRKDQADAIRRVAARHSDRLLLLTADVTDRAGLEAARDRCTALLGHPSIVVNNAGIDRPPSAHSPTWRFGDIPDELSANLLDVNALGALRVCQVFGPGLVRRGAGSVINIGSLYGSVAPDPRMYEHLPVEPPFLKPPAYGMSKAGVAALTRYLAALWGPAGVRVNTLSPGGVLGGQDRRFREKFCARVPLRRMAADEDLAGPLLFLASDLSRYVTGTEMVVDGGYLHS